MRKFNFRIALGLGIFGLLATSHLGWKLTARDAYETAQYEVLRSDGAFEIRAYPDLTLATTRMPAKGRGDDGSFMRLFRYISGGNISNQKVAMTTPVFMTAEAETDAGQMGFMIPKQVASEGAPKPESEQVEIETRAGGQFAVVRFNGRLNDELIELKTSELRQWMAEQGVRGEGQVEVAGYDPPWTPAVLRRNEVMIRVPSAE